MGLSTNNLESNVEKLLKIRSERKRTNLFKNHEQRLIAFLVVRIPRFISPDILTALAFGGAILTGLSFTLAKYFNQNWLLLGILGIMVNRLFDSLDGNLAYFRNIPRKWYGFTLDFIFDWLSVIIFGIGYIVYLDGNFKLLGFLMVTLYGWAMMMAVTKYKITNDYIIDAGRLGPTEVSMILVFFLFLEIIWRGSLIYSSMVCCVVLFTVNVINFMQLLKEADKKDKEEQKLELLKKNT